MNTLKLKLILLFCLITITCIGQDCKNSKKMSKKAKKHLVDEEIIKATNFKVLFKKLTQVAIINFVKSNEGYYLSMQLSREYGRRIDIMKENPLIVQFKNDSIITLYPNKSILGKFSIPVTVEFNKPFYKVSPEQLELFASQPIGYVKIYFTSEKVSENKRGIDNIGTFFDYEILNERYQANLIDLANCILQ